MDRAAAGRGTGSATDSWKPEPRSRSAWLLATGGASSGKWRLQLPDQATRTLFDKLWNSHAVVRLEEGAELIAIDRIFLHERTGSVALKALADAGRSVADPARVFCTMDHIVDTRPGRTGTLVKGGDVFLTKTRAAARAAGIRLFDIDD